MFVRVALFSSVLILVAGGAAYAGPAAESDDKPKPKITAPTRDQLSASPATVSSRGLASADDKGDDKGGDKGGGKKIAAFMSSVGVGASARGLASGEDKDGGKDDKGGGKKLPGASTYSPATLQTTQQTAASPQ